MCNFRPHAAYGQRRLDPMKQMPGVMLYFDTRSCLDLLTREEAGALFFAILDYGQFGILPELTGGAAVAWAFLRPYVDRDRARYEEKSRRSTEAANRRWGNSPALSGYETMPKTETKTETKTKISSKTRTGTGTKTPTAPEERRKQWAHVLTIEEEIAEKNRQAQALFGPLRCTPPPFLSQCGEDAAADSATSSMNSAMAGL